MPDPGATEPPSVLARGDADREAAESLARRLRLPLAAGLASDRAALHLVVDGDRLALQQAGRRAPGPVYVDFASGALRHRRRSGANELLGRAVGVTATRSPAVLDATAGLAVDAFVLADLGCHVTLCERDPVIAALIENGLSRLAAVTEPRLAAVWSRMELVMGDARTLPLAPVDVIYLDPMFPNRDKSAAVRKEMVVFQQLLAAAPADQDDLLHWALAQDVARVVVKRPARAPELAGVSPSHCIRGKAVRYDVHVRRALPPVSVPGQV